MMKHLLMAAAVAAGLAWGGAAEACSSNPYNLVNGTTADASQVMADINNALGCIGALQPNATGSTTLATGLTIPAPTISGNTTAAVRVASNAAMAAIATATYPNGVMRDDYAGGIGAPSQYYRPETGSCGANSRVNDGGSCTDTTAGDGNSWYAVWPGGGMDIREWGVKTDGVTDAAVAWKAAAVACRAAGGATVLIPAGQIALTSATQIDPSDCQWLSQNIDGGGGKGSFILVENSSVAPFYCGNHWTFAGLQFYWPGQINGSTVFPPLISAPTSADCTGWTFDKVGVLNSYIMLSGSYAGGRWSIANSRLYAVKYLFDVGTTGDYTTFDDTTIYDPGAWWDYLHFSTASVNAVRTAIVNGNTIFHIKAPPPGNGAWQVKGRIQAFAWGNLIVQDDSSLFTASLEVAGDGVANYVDATALATAGSLSQIYLSCQTGCNAKRWQPSGTDTTAHVPFNFATSTTPKQTLYLENFLGACLGAYGDLIHAGSANIYVDKSNLCTQDDGVNTVWVLTNVAAGGGSTIRFRNSQLSGQVGSPRTFGINKQNALTQFIVKDTNFSNVKGDINAVFNDGYDEIVGTTFGTTAAGYDVTASGSAVVHWHDNQMSIGFAPTVANCGVGASVSGTPATGTIFTGSGNPTSCEVTWPINMESRCLFPPNGGNVALTATKSGSPPTYTVQRTDGAAMSAFFYDCPVGG